MSTDSWPTRLVIATRGSELALWQANHVKAQLERVAPGIVVELEIIKTSGDKILDVPLAKVGGKGLFVKEIEQALVEKRADLAVHSMKDVPAELAPGLTICAVSTREVPWDALCTRDGKPLDQLAQGAVVGTSSMRRQSQLLAIRPDLQIKMLRGNVPTRLRKLDAGEFDAIVLAAAGLARLGLSDVATERLDPSVCLPAVGQGALGIEQRAHDERAAVLLALANDQPTCLAVHAERGVMRAVEGNCQTPVAAYAVREGDVMWLRAFLAEPDGSRPRRREVRTPWPENYEQAELIGRELGSGLRG